MTRPIWFLILAFSAATLVFSGCELGAQGHQIIVDNQTGAPIEFHENGALLFVIQPKTEEKFDTFQFNNSRFYEFRVHEGEILFSDRLTWADLEARDWTFTLRQSNNDYIVE